MSIPPGTALGEYFRGCPACAEYFSRRGAVISRAIVRRRAIALPSAPKLGRASLLLHLVKYIAGVHDRHLAGLPIT
jgi:hypothetical protein